MSGGVSGRSVTPGSATPAGWFRLWGASLILWTLLALLSAAQSYALTRGQGSPPSWLRLVAWQIPQWYSWALLTPLIVWCDGRARAVDSFRRPWLVHVPVGALAILLHSLVVTASDLGFMGTSAVANGFLPLLASHLRGRTQFEVLTYLGIVGVWYAVDGYRRRQQESLSAAEARTALARAELRALKMQIQPHFLFNTLQAIAVLNERDPAAATATLQLLADLLRAVLHSGGVQEVPLARELEFLDRYLDIERIRFPDRLTVDFDIPPETRPALVPLFILQPIVENAVRHGIATRTGPGTIAIRARRREQHLEVAVTDDGLAREAAAVTAAHPPDGSPPGTARAEADATGARTGAAVLVDPASGAVVGDGKAGDAWTVAAQERPGRPAGLGLSITRDRLRYLYGEDASFHLARTPTGAVATLRLPYRNGPGEG